MSPCETDNMMHNKHFQMVFVQRVNAVQLIKKRSFVIFASLVEGCIINLSLW